MRSLAQMQEALVAHANEVPPAVMSDLVERWDALVTDVVTLVAASQDLVDDPSEEDDWEVVRASNLERVRSLVADE